MPLFKSPSKKALDKNMESEMESGKPQDQSLAIAYSVQRKNKKKRMAMGGQVSPMEEQEMERHASLASAIMAKKREAHMYAEGGQVDLEESSEEQPNQADEMNLEAALKEQYDDSQLEPQPMDSNEHGDHINSDSHDMIDMIRQKMKAKRSF